MRNLMFKCFLILSLCLLDNATFAQSTKNEILKGKTWELQLPEGKSYTSNLIFKDSIYTTNFCFNGQTYTIEKPYLTQQENSGTFYIIPLQKERKQKVLSVKFKVLKITDNLLKLQNTTTNVVNTYFAK